MAELSPNTLGITYASQMMLKSPTIKQEKEESSLGHPFLFYPKLGRDWGFFFPRETNWQQREITISMSTNAELVFMETLKERK